MTSTRRDHGVRLPTGDVVEVESYAAATTLRELLGNHRADHVVRSRTTGPWRLHAEPMFPGRRGYHDPQPDRYIPGSEFPDHGGIAGFNGIDPSTRRIVAAVLDELAHDVSELSSPDTIREVITARARTIGAPRP